MKWEYRLILIKQVAQNNVPHWQIRVVFTNVAQVRHSQQYTPAHNLSQARHQDTALHTFKIVLLDRSFALHLLVTSTSV
jgi:hypothetical protein